MKITVVTCDNCGERCDENFFRIETLSQDWCVSCREGKTLELHLEPYHTWPKRITKESVRHVFENYDSMLEEKKIELNTLNKKHKTVMQELKDLRRQAADAFHDQRRPIEALSDIATAARRPNGEG